MFLDTHAVARIPDGSGGVRDQLVAESVPFVHPVGFMEFNAGHQP